MEDPHLLALSLRDCFGKVARYTHPENCKTGASLKTYILDLPFHGAGTVVERGTVSVPISVPATLERAKCLIPWEMAD